MYNRLSEDDWAWACDKFCQEIGAELLSVDDNGFRYLLDGCPCHMYATDLVVLLMVGRDPEGQKKGK